MINFRSFLVESKQGAKGAHGGVAFELHTMHALTGSPPDNFRTKEGKSPSEAAVHVQKSMAPQDHIESKAAGTHAAGALKDHLKKTHPEYKISKVHWTSEKKDIQKFHDAHNSKKQQTVDDNADYVVSLKHPKTGDVKHVGVSSKKESHSTMTPGHKTLAKMHGGSDGVSTIKTFNAKLDKHMEKSKPGFSGMTSKAKADHFRVLRSSTKPADIEVHNQAKSIARDRGVALANHHHEHFSKTSTPNMKKAVKSLVGSGNKSIETLKVHHEKGKTHISDYDSKANKFVDSMNKVHTTVDKNRIHFHGTDSKGATHKLASLEFRSKSLGSSPHTPYNGSKPGASLTKATK